nr:PREDICTED: CD276 antigen homolog [Latimeria chalumnae]XP_014353890.1 PREDICTED: CD276 antigen homolog [Latimeria chalumnae]|eukprot:XP_014353889.1 PREDICTED: CD276 antigen homolog [Latimeria chalumnae]
MEEKMMETLRTGMNTWNLATTVLSLILLLYTDVSGATQTLVVSGCIKQDIMLPCVFSEDPMPNWEFLTVNWKHDNKVVHSYHKSRDYPEYQDVQFKGRTKLFHSELKKSNASLLLRNPTEADRGEYFCEVDLTEDIHKHVVFVNVTGKLEDDTSDCVELTEYNSGDEKVKLENYTSDSTKTEHNSGGHATFTLMVSILIISFCFII